MNTDEGRRVRAQMRILARLQELDGKIQKLKEQIATVPEDILTLREAISQGERSLEEMREKREGLAKERRHKEMGLGTKEDGLSKYRSQLYEVKTNKEYSALMVEIDSLKQENSELEDEVLGLMERGDELTALVKRTEEELGEERERLTKEESKNRERVSALEENRRVVGGEREELAKNVDGPLLSSYERIRKGKAGLALVPVRDDACQGCFMELPPQTINEIMKGDEIVTCERCSRILYLEEKSE